MRCPYCGDVSNRVIDSRLTREGHEIRRRRGCEECGRRFTTRERVEDVLPKLIKRDERREEYDRAKLEHGIQKACAKRPVSEVALQRLVDRVERRLAESGEAELPTAFVGDCVLAELIALDRMAAARFASVFRGFGSAAEYDAFFAELGEADGALPGHEPER
jgi:transcriptional repressor NrdR